MKAPRPGTSLLLLLPALAAIGPAARAGEASPFSETVVVTATLAPEEESQIGSAVTVIPRERLVETGCATVLEALRLVPGLDVVRAGGDGAVTSVFLHGAASAGALVLVDGVRVNSPYFGGFDFGSLGTDAVERIEIVRGPFSALYGSDALGGVVQIFTRAPSSEGRAEATIEAGNADRSAGTLFATAGVGPVAIAASARGASSGGDRPNADWRSWSGSLRAAVRATERISLALEAAVLDAESGIPGPVGGETPSARGASREERVALPVSWRRPGGRESSFLAATTRSVLDYRNPDDPWLAESDSVASSEQARWTETWRAGTHDLAAFADWESVEATSSTSAGLALDRDSSRSWGIGAQDSLGLPRDVRLTVGLRYDRHSAFDGTWSPRATVSRLVSGGRLKIRASSGRAFRAPSIGELYYPWSGNPDLEPERSTTHEIGLERYVGRGRAELSLFRSDFRDLIVYDFATQRNENVGLARARGMELAWTGPVGRRLTLDAGYALLDAVDRRTGDALPRRPRHRAHVAATVKPRPGLVGTLRATWVGERQDVDALTFEPVSAPSHLRLDLFARGGFARYSPYLRIENLTDRGYEEADGYPAPGRRFAAGLDVRL